MEPKIEYTRRLAEFCAGVSYEKLPADVIEKTKLCILDYFANVYGSLQLDAVKKIVGYVRSMDEGGNTTALGCGFTTGLRDGVFLNGTAGEAVEAQDGLRFGGNHPGAAVIPAALAIAEKQRLGGRAVIEAVVAGYEAANRPAAAMHPHHTLGGFLPTGTCGTFGAAAAASRLMGHNVETMLNSLGTAGYILPLSMAEHLMGGYTSKIVQAGQAAAAGVTAAGLAGAGITGPPYVLEGSHLKGGFTTITTNGKPDLSRIVDGLGEKFTIMDIYLKPYTACRHTHGAAQAAAELRREDNFKPGDIESVKVFTYAIAALATGKYPGADGGFVAAQFSIPYVTAACLMDGDMGPAQLADSRIADPELQALCSKVSVQVDMKLNAAYPDMTSSRVEILLNGGRKLESQVDIPAGDPRAPMTAGDVTVKMKRFAGENSRADFDAISQMTLDFENVADIRQLTCLI